MRLARGGVSGASLVEVMTAVAVVVLLLTLLLEFASAVTRAWDRERSRGERLRLGRNALSLMAADLASICRSPHATNLAIGNGAGDGPWLAALVTRPGHGCDVCAVGYGARTDAGSGQTRLVRSFLPAIATLEMLCAGEDPLRPGPTATDEPLAPRVSSVRFEAIPDPSGPASGPTVFITNLPDAIEVSFSIEGAEGDDAIPFRCRLPLQ
jgi:type II secretory pathway pseudopilin PulG